MIPETETPPASAELALPIQAPAGDFKISADPAALKARDNLVAESKAITTVTTTDQAEAAHAIVKRLADCRIQIEKSRVKTKEPYLERGKKIDEFAKEYRASVELEEARLSGVVLTFNRAEEEKRRAAEALALAARQKAEREAQELERQRIAMEAQVEHQKQAEAAKNFTGLDSMLGIAPQAIPEPAVAIPAGKTAAEVASDLRAAEDTAKANLAQAQADEFSALTAGPAVKGANKVISIEVEKDKHGDDRAGLLKLLTAYPELVTLTLKLADTKERVKKFADQKGGELPVIPGLVITYTDRLSKR